MSLYQEVRLYTNASQREAFDNRAELYSIIKTIQELEVSWPKIQYEPYYMDHIIWSNSQGEIMGPEVFGRVH